MALDFLCFLVFENKHRPFWIDINKQTQGELFLGFLHFEY